MEDKPWTLGSTAREELALLLCGQKDAKKAERLAFPLPPLNETCPTLFSEIRQYLGSGKETARGVMELLRNAITFGRENPDDIVRQNHLLVAWHLLALDGDDKYPGDLIAPSNVRIDQVHTNPSYSSPVTRRAWCSTFYRDTIEQVTQEAFFKPNKDCFRPFKNEKKSLGQNELEARPKALVDAIQGAIYRYKEEGNHDFAAKTEELEQVPADNTATGESTGLAEVADDDRRDTAATDNVEADPVPLPVGMIPSVPDQVDTEYLAENVTPADNSVEMGMDHRSNGVSELQGDEADCQESAALNDSDDLGQPEIPPLVPSASLLQSTIPPSLDESGADEPTNHSGSSEDNEPSVEESDFRVMNSDDKPDLDDHLTLEKHAGTPPEPAQTPPDIEIELFVENPSEALSVEYAAKDALTTEENTSEKKRRFLTIAVGMVAVVGIVAAGISVWPYLQGNLPSAQSGERSESIPLANIESVSDADLGSEPYGGWGPARNLYSYGDTINEVTLNSVIDSPTYSDERDFTQIGHVDAPPEEYSSDILLQPGETYTVYTRFSNNATGDAQDYSATNVKVKSQAPATFAGSALMYSTITSDNATPGEIWDGIRLRTASPDDYVALRYVPDSAVLHTDGKADGTPLSDDLYLEGTLVGFDQLDGILPPGEDFAGYITYQFVADQPNFTVSIEAKPKGSSTDYSSASATRDGETLIVRVTYTNTGTVTIDDVVVSANIPEPFRHVRNTTRLANSASPDGFDLRHDEYLTTDGLNIGEYAPGETATIEFEMLNYDADMLLENDDRWLTLEDLITIRTSNGNKSADLRLVVNE